MKEISSSAAVSSMPPLQGLPDVPPAWPSSAVAMMSKEPVDDDESKPRTTTT
jgi:hypothetical protein